MDESAPLFTVVDRWDRRIVLSVKQWQEHILIEHPEMTHQLNRIEWCVSKPDCVQFDRVHPFRECYYLSYRTPRGLDLVLKVVVHLDPTPSGKFEADGFIVTTHLMRRINPKEARKWP